MERLELADHLLSPIHQRIADLTVHVVKIAVDHFEAVIAAQRVLITGRKMPVKRIEHTRVLTNTLFD